MSQINNGTFSTVFSTMEVLHMYLLYIKSIFSRNSNFFSLVLKLVRFSCFQECRFWRDQRSQFETDRFLNVFFMSFLDRHLIFVNKYLVR